MSSTTTPDDQPKIIPRAEAKMKKLNRYFTGKTCKNGHLAQRYTTGGNCLTCASIRQASCYRADSNRIKEVIAAWQKANTKRTKANAAAYYERNIDRLRERNRLFKKQKPEKMREYSHARRARFLNAEGRWTPLDIENLLTAQFHSCVGCDVMFYEDQSYHIDHMIPLSRGGSNWPSNLQILCPDCNLRKGSLTDEEWRASLRFPKNVSASTFACT